MKSVAEGTVSVFAIFAIIFFVIFFCSLPFAFVGWILLLAANVFGAGAAVTYWTSLIVGAGVSIIIALINAMR